MRPDRNRTSKHAIARPLLALAIALSSLTLAKSASAQLRDDLVNVVIPQRRVMLGPVRMTAVDAKVAIVEQIAATSMRINLRNDAARVQEAQLLLPVPEGAVVKSLVLEGLGEEGIARILPADEARRIYNTIVSQTRDPALLEFAGYNLIRSSVFPVPARGEQAITITYEQVLPSDAGRVDYKLPRSESLEQPGVAWSFSVDIRSKQPISTVYSPSHDLSVDRASKNRVKAKVPQSSALNDLGPLLVSYLVETDGGVAASMLAYPDATVGDGEGGYFLLLAGVPAERPENAEALKREVILVIDRSGSMRDEKIEQAREAALQVIEGLEDGEYFNILDYSNAVEMFADAPVAKNARTIEQAREYLASLKAIGGTALNDALVEALRQDHKDGTLPVVLFLTDGLPTVGERGEVAIRDGAKAANKHNRRVFTFGVGYDVNTPLLNAIAGGSRATATFVLPEEDVEVKVGQVFRRLHGPVLSSPTLTVLGKDGEPTTRAVRELMPGELPDLFEGDQLVLLGQFTEDEPLQMRLTGDYFGKQRTFEFSFSMDKGTTRNSFVPRLWASRKIAMLVDEIRKMGADTGGLAPTPATEDPRFKELVDEIVTLSTKWGVLTEYTSFLALEPGMWNDRDLAARYGFVPMGEPQNSLGLAPTTDVLNRVAGEALEARAQRERAGKGAVAQEMNAGQRADQLKLNRGNLLLNEDLEAVQFSSIKQINDETYYFRGGQWVDSRILAFAAKDKEQAEEAEKPDETIEFGTEAFDTLLTKLVKANRQGERAIGGDVYLTMDSKRIVVRLPELSGEGE